MTLEAALTVLESHLTAAGAAVSPTITDVDRGAVAAVNGRLIRYWYAGDGDPINYEGNETLTTRMVGEQLTIAVYWPVSDRSVLQAIDLEIIAINRQIKTRLLGDSQLGGNCDDMELGGSQVDYPLFNGQQIAELTIPVTLDFADGGYPISG